MNIAVVGMGIIGGSFCKAFKKYTDHYIIGINRTQSTLQQAFDCGAIDEMGNEESLSNADVVIMAVYPQATVEYIEKYGSYLKKGCIVTDSSGIKTEICPQMVALSKKFGFTFVGSHPMAGKETSGIEYANTEMFKKANFIITPTEKNTEKAIEFCHDMAYTLHFNHIAILTIEQHDRMIAFLSQLCHVIAVSLMNTHDNSHLVEYTGDSFRDLTRIAQINENMWSELFLLNKDILLDEINQFIDSISHFRDALQSEDEDEMKRLFIQSTQRRKAFNKKDSK